jgi:hypothetical protein
MRSHLRAIIGSVVGVGVLMIFILGFHLGGDGILKVGLYSQLLGAFIGGTLALLSANIRFQPEETAVPWLGRERLAWTFIGCGCILWGIGECFWLCWLLWTSVQEIGPVVHDGASFLAKGCEIRVQSTRSILRICSDRAPIFTKKRFHSCCVYFPRSSYASVFACTRSKNVFCVGSNH